MVVEVGGNFGGAIIGVGVGGGGYFYVQLGTLQRRRSDTASRHSVVEKVNFSQETQRNLARSGGSEGCFLQAVRKELTKCRW